METFNLKLNGHTARILIAALTQMGHESKNSRDREGQSAEDAQSDQNVLNRAFRMIGDIITAAQLNLPAREANDIAGFANWGWEGLVDESPRPLKDFTDIGPDGQPALYPSQRDSSVTFSGEYTEIHPTAATMVADRNGEILG